MSASSACGDSTAPTPPARSNGSWPRSSRLSTPMIHSLRSLCRVTAVPTAASSPPLRSRVKQYAGRAVSTLLKLPPHTTAYSVHRGLRVPMRDGVELIPARNVPQTAEPAGTLLLRGPYGRRWAFSALFASVYAARGYHVVFQSVRGT